VEHPVGQLLLEGLALGDAAKGHHHAEGAVATEHRRGRDSHREVRPVGAGEHVVVVACGASGGQHGAQPALVGVALAGAGAGVHDVVQRLVEQAALVEPEHALGGRVGEGDEATVVEGDDPLGQAGGDGAQPFEHRGVPEGARRHRSQRPKEALVVLAPRASGRTGGHLHGEHLVDVGAERSRLGRRAGRHQAGLGAVQEPLGRRQQLGDHLAGVHARADGAGSLVEALDLVTLVELGEGAGGGDLEHGDGQRHDEQEPQPPLEGRGQQDPDGKRRRPRDQAHQEAVTHRLEVGVALDGGDDPGHQEHGDDRVHEPADSGGEQRPVAQVAHAGAEQPADGDAGTGCCHHLTDVEGGLEQPPPGATPGRPGRPSPRRRATRRA